MLPLTRFRRRAMLYQRNSRRREDGADRGRTIFKHMRRRFYPQLMSNKKTTLPAECT